MKIAYLGGWSREWARKLMFDLALCPALGGQVALCDIDLASAQLNAEFGNWLEFQPGVMSCWQYHVVPELFLALSGANLVVASIQPSSLDAITQEMAIAEKYDLKFPVDDTSGVPGLVRGLHAAIVDAESAAALPSSIPPLVARHAANQERIKGDWARW